MKLIVDINSSNGMYVFFSICVHLFVMLCTARLRGMLVNSDIVCKGINTSLLLIFVFERTLYYSKLFLTCLLL